jgi:hypothetical protein
VARAIRELAARKRQTMTKVVGDIVQAELARLDALEAKVERGGEVRP